MPDMTGIERLRKVSEQARRRGCPIEHCPDVPCRDCWGAILSDIADQIEAEQEERITRRVEDREAAEWVRERGGLDTVRERWHGRVARAHVEHMAERQRERRERMQRHIEYIQRLCRERRERITKLNRLVSSYRDALNGVCKRLGLTDGTGLPDMPEVIWTELDLRLMPEGMDWLLDVWPKWSNGEYCKFGDWWKADEYSEREPSRLTKLSIYSPEQLREWEQDEGENYGYEWNFMRPANTTCRPNKVEPPAPKVYDADGVEIRVGDECYVASNGDGPYVVYRIREADGAIDMHWHENRNESLHIRPDLITHRAPVLAADGKPLREGETVYLTDSPTAFVVDDIMTREDGATVVHLKDGAWNLPQYLTHERPDSWERLEEDIVSGFMDTGETVCDCREEAKDIVRRAKALAERDA